MLLDMQNVSLQAAEVFAFPDWAYGAPPRTPVLEQVVIRGSITGGTTLSLTGTPDDPRNNNP